MKTRTKLILGIMNVLSWIIFIGLCIKAGAILFSFFISLFINPVAAKDLYLGLNLSDLKAFGVVHYSIMVLMVFALWALKAYMFYFVIKIFLKINFVQPFSTNMALLITKISYVALAVGIGTMIATGFSEWLTKQGVRVNNLPLYIDGSGVFLFFAGIIFIISLVFKRGIEIQSENELTV